MRIFDGELVETIADALLKADIPLDVTVDDQTAPVAAWLVRHVEGQPVAALTMDRYRQSELGEAIDRAGIRAPLVWRGQGFRDSPGIVDLPSAPRRCTAAIGLDVNK
jgi:hypothetical protein